MLHHPRGGGVGGCPCQGCHQMSHGRGCPKIGQKSVTHYMYGP